MPQDACYGEQTRVGRNAIRLDPFVSKISGIPGWRDPRVAEVVDFYYHAIQALDAEAATVVPQYSDDVEPE